MASPTKRYSLIIGGEPCGVLRLTDPEHAALAQRLIMSQSTAHPMRLEEEATEARTWRWGQDVFVMPPSDMSKEIENFVADLLTDKGLGVIENIYGSGKAEELHMEITIKLVKT